jgi:hypothetical protein
MDLELGFVDKIVEVAPIARPGHLRIYGRKKYPEGYTNFYLNFALNSRDFTETNADTEPKIHLIY